jgi:uncharacterized protein YndB with AHSA1/START domain
MRSIVHSVHVTATPADVWRVLTTRGLVREWAAAFAPDIDLQTNWRLGARIIWRAPSEGFERHGVIAEFERERRLAFHYADDPQGPFTVTYAIRSNGRGTELHYSAGPLTDDTFERLEPVVRAALNEIRGLAEEAAAIRRGR